MAIDNARLALARQLASRLKGGNVSANSAGGVPPVAALRRKKRLGYGGVQNRAASFKLPSE